MPPHERDERLANRVPSIDLGEVLAVFAFAQRDEHFICVALHHARHDIGGHCLPQDRALTVGETFKVIRQVDDFFFHIMGIQPYP